MPYTINYAPNIAAMGQLAFAGGYGSRKNELNDQALRMAMQERAFNQQMQQQERQQGFTRERDMWGAQQEDQRYQRSWADKQAAEESDRAWREGQSKTAFDRQQQAADAASKRAVQQDLDITTQRAKIHDDKLKGQEAAIDAEMAAREHGFETAGMDKELQGVDYDGLARMRDQIVQIRYGLQPRIPKERPEEIAPGLMWSPDSGYARLPNAKTEKPEYSERQIAGMVQQQYNRRRSENERSGKNVSDAELLRQAKDDVAEITGTGMTSEQKDLFPYMTAGGGGPAQQSQPQQQIAGKAPVTQSPSGPQAQVGASGQPMPQGGFREMASIMQGAKQAMGGEPQQSGQYPQPRTPGERDSLPPGTMYMAPNGQLKIKG
jgi:hypothetical protein